nr:unnamed protein product [Callosobruchus analis]
MVQIARLQRASLRRFRYTSLESILVLNFTKCKK